MPSRSYIVNYDINARTNKAVEAFRAMVGPMQEVAQAMSVVERSINSFVESQNALKNSLGKFQFKPTVDLTAYKDALATMEVNAKETATRIRSVMEASLGGTRQNFDKYAQALTGGNFKEVRAGLDREVRNMQSQIKLVNAVWDKLFARVNKGSSAERRAQIASSKQLLDQMVGSGVDPYKEVDKLLRRAGYAGAIKRTADGNWIANEKNGADGRTKFSEFKEQLNKDFKDLNQKNATIAQMQEKRSAAFKESMRPVNGGTGFMGMMGVTTSEINAYAQSLKSITSALSAMPANGYDIPIKLTLGNLSGIESQLTSQISALQRIVDERQLMIRTAFGGSTQQINKEQERFAKSIQTPRFKYEGPARTKFNYVGESFVSRKYTDAEWRGVKYAINNPLWWNDPSKEGAAMQDKLEQRYNELIKDRQERYRQLMSARQRGVWLRPWSPKVAAKPVEQMQAVAEAQQSMSSQTTIKFDIIGNFADKLGTLERIREVIATTPKAVKIDVMLTDNSNAALTALGGIKSMQNQGKGTGKGKGKADVSIGVRLDQGTAATDMATFMTELQRIANEKFVKIKTKLATPSEMVSKFNAIIDNLLQIANEKIVKIKTLLDRSTLGTSLNQAIQNLQQLANSRAVRLKASLTTSGLQTSLQQALSALKTNGTKLPIDAIVNKVKMPTVKQPIKVNAIIDKAPKFAQGANAGITANIRGIVRIFKGQVQAEANKISATIKARLKLMWGVGNQSKQSQIKNFQSKLPALQIKLDISEAEAALNRLIAKIKALSPQTIRVTDRINGGNGGNQRYGGTAGGTRSVQNGTLYDRTRRAMYPFTGNTSFGARTPVAFDMVKGMGMMYGIGGAMGVISDSFGQAVQYQNTMETARAILEQNYKGRNFNAEFNDMVKKARDIAVKTKFTAAQTSDAVRFMAMAGLNIPMIKASIAPIADVAVIGDNDLGEVADKITNIQTAFKIKPENMRHLADALTKTFTSTNTDMMMLAESMQYAAPMAHLAGASIEDTLSMIGIMGNSGIQASMAGTTLRMMYQNIIRPNKKQQQMWDKLGIKLTNDDGSTRNMIDVLSELRSKLPKERVKDENGQFYDKETKLAQAVSTLFRVTASAGAGSIIESIDKVKQLAEQIRNSNGISEYVSGKKQATVSGLWHQVTSAFTEGVVKVFENNETQVFIKETLGKLKAMFASPEFTETLHNLFGLIKDIGSVMATFVGWWIKLYQTFPNLTKWVMVGQAFFTQIGYLMTPFVQFIGLLDKLGITMTRINAQGVALNGTMGYTAGGMITAATNPLFGGKVNPALYMRYAEAAKVNQNRADALNAAIVASMATNQRTARMSQLAFESQRRATEYAAAAQVARAQYMKNRLQDTALLQRAASMGKLSWKGLGAGVGAAFNAGMTAMTFTSLWGSIKGGLTGVVLNLSRVLGMLINPTTAAIAAIGGLGVVAWNIINNAREEKLRGQNIAKRTAQNIKATNDLFESGNGWTVSGDGVNLTQKQANVVGAARRYTNVMLSRAAGFADIYHSSLRGEDYFKAMWENHIAPNKDKLFAGDMDYETFKDRAFRGGNAFKMFKDYAERGAMYDQIVKQNPYVKSAFKQANAVWEEFERIAPDKRTDEDRKNLRMKLIAIRDRFSKWQSGNLERLSEMGDLSNLPAYRIFESYEGQKRAWEFFDNIAYNRGNSPFSFKYAVEDLAASGSDNTRPINPYSLDTVLSNIAIPFYNGIKKETFTIPFENMKPVWSELAKKLSDFGIKFGDSEIERKTILTEIVQKLNEKLPDLITRLGGINTVVSQILGKIDPDYKAIAMANAQIYVERLKENGFFSFKPYENTPKVPIPSSEPVEKVPIPLAPAPQDKKYKFGWGANGNDILSMQESTKAVTEKLKQNPVSNIDQREYASTYTPKNGGGKAPISINLGGINFGNIQVENSDQHQIAEEIENKIAEGLAIAMGNLQPMLASVAENELS